MAIIKTAAVITKALKIFIKRAIIAMKEEIAIIAAKTFKKGDAKRKIYLN